MTRHYDIHDIFDQDTKQDGVAKMLFTHKQIVAWILRECFPEFKGYPLDFIIDNCLDCLDDVDYLIGDTTHGSGGTDMDVCIHVRLPQDLETKIGIIINIEIQNDFYPGYNIIKRGIYYECDLIAREKETVFTDSHYDDVKKVYTVWICLQAPVKLANTFERYGMAKLNLEDEIHAIHQNGAPYDLLDMVMIYLNNECQEGGGPFMAMMRTLFSPTLSKKEKLKILKERYSITFTQEDDKMNDFIEYVKQVNLKLGEEIGEERGLKLGEERGLKLGEERGLKQARRTVVANMLRNGRDEKDIQMALGLPNSQIVELIRDVRANSQDSFGK